MGIAWCWQGGDGGEPVGCCGRGPSSLGSPAVAPGLEGLGKLTQLDVGPAAAQGDVCVRTSRHVYISTPSAGDAPWVLLPSLRLGTELSNPCQLSRKERKK